MPVDPSIHAFATQNPHATDRGDHWRTPDAVSMSLGPERTTGDTSDLSTALAADEQKSSNASSMQAVDPSAVATIGTLSAITIGRSTAGPADAMDIEFYYDDP